MTAIPRSQRTAFKHASQPLIDAPSGRAACVLRSLSLRKKFAAMLAALLMPLALLTVLFVRDNYADIQLAQRALMGLPYLAALRGLAEDLLEFRAVTREYLDGKPDVEPKMLEARERIVGRFATIERLDNQHGWIASSSEWQALTAQWARFLSQHGRPSSMEALDRLIDIAGTTHEVLLHVADTAGLTQALDDHGQRLARLLLEDLARLPERAAHLRRASILIIQQQSKDTPFERFALTNLVNELRQRVRDINASIQHASRTHVTLGNVLNAEHTALQDAYKVFTSYIERGLITKQEAAPTPADIMQIGGKATAATFAFYDVALGQLKALLKQRISQTYQALLAKIITVALALAVAVFLYLRVTRSVLDPLNDVKAIFKNLAAGQFNNRMVIQYQDEIGDVLRALSGMQAKLGADRDAMQRRNIEVGRLKAALDSASVGVIVADDQSTIAYVNPALQAMFQKYQREFAKHAPHIADSRLVGANLNALQIKASDSHNPAGSPESSRSMRWRLDSAEFEIVLNPIRDESGKRIGTVLEWNDRTTQAATEAEVQHVVNAVIHGDLHQRIPLTGKEGFFLTLARDINTMTENVEALVNETAQALGAVAQGDLRHSVASDCSGAFGQLKCNVNRMIATLTDMIEKIRAAAEEVKNGATEIAQANLDLSQRTEEQAANLQVSASNMNQLAQIVRTNVTNAHQANQIAAEAHEQAELGGNAVRNAVVAMNQINASSEKMEDIIGAIDELAFQTNLLALNAAVEAARAGDHGRGFAVVASEVRALAQRSAAAAKEIKALIEDSRGKVNTGAHLVNDSGKALERIIASVKRVSERIAEIAGGGDEQLAGIDQANSAIQQIDDATQQNAALVEETAAASKALGDQAHNLAQQVSMFRLLENPNVSRLPATPEEGAQPRVATERRGANRPWSKPKPLHPTVSAPTVAATGTDGDWEVF